MRRPLVVVALMALLVPATLWAQGELTLEGLAEELRALEERIERMEALWQESGPVEDGENGCVLAMETWSAELVDLNVLRDETVAKYKQAFGEWLDIDDVTIHSVLYNSKDGRFGVSYFTGSAYEPGRMVVEEWEGCEFVGSSDWWEQE